MSRERPTVSVRDLAEEAKKRIVFLIVCVVGLSYLMSLTSSSVLVNFPAAALLIIILRYLSLDIEMRRKSATYKAKPTPPNTSSAKKPFEGTKVISERSNWKHKVNSPVVEDTIDQFTRHIVSEWVTDLWYSRITPDRQAPEELVLIINGVFGEISSRLRNINLIELLTRDIINLLCIHLELFRASKIKIEKRNSKFLTIAERDIELKSVLAAENKLHPALFSAEAEHKVLQHVMDGLIYSTFKPEDLQCSLFHYIVRELLSCVVIRPVLNLANPRFINERLENIIISKSKTDQGSKAPQSKANESTKTTPDPISRVPDPSINGVELKQLKKEQDKDPLLSMDTQSTRSWNSLPESDNVVQWGDRLDGFSRRKTEALTPENLENMWTKGKNYKKKEETNKVGFSNSVEPSKGHSWENKNEKGINGNSLENDKLYEESHGHTKVPSNEVEYWSSSFTDEEDTSSVMGLDSPGVKVWDGKNKRNFNHIHHPLEALDGRKSKKTSKSHLNAKRLHKTKSTKKKSRPSINKELMWQEIERTSFLSGDGQDILNSSKLNVKAGDSSEDSEAELKRRVFSGATTSSSMSLDSLPENQSLAANSAKNSIIADSFYRLRCEVLGANIVKSGSKTFAVYSVSVTDIANHSWSIKRRFRHFEELHWRLKDFPEYNLHLPPKHFLSTGLDVYVIQERCILLDQYLKKLLQLPTISCSIEVWDFLSVDSQMYVFSNSLSIIETLSVSLENTVSDKSKEYRDNISPKGNFNNGNQNSASRVKVDRSPDVSRLKTEVQDHSTSKKPNKEGFEDLSSDPEMGPNRDKQAFRSVQDNEEASDPIPSEWVSPNLSVPILDLVDVILQLKDGGWIRRKAFWVAKQILQLGMGDAFDDWLVEKIQILRRGSVVASGVRRLEQILWPDGIFITKHPRRQKPSPATTSEDSSTQIEAAQNFEEIQNKEAERRAKLVYEIMIDKAPAAVVGLVGRSEYEHCAKDLYYFIQSSVCMKLLAFDLLELLLVTAFPELDHVFRQLVEEKQKFGELKLN